MPTSPRYTFVRAVPTFATAALVFLAACSNDTLTAPVVSRAPALPTTYTSIKVPIAGILKMLFPMDALTRDEALTEPVTRSFTFSTKGGRLEMKELGLRVDVPEGAIPGNSLTITVTALPGSDVAYDFQPHGTVFLKPLAFRQDLDNTSWDHSDFKGVVIGGYFETESQLHAIDGLALLNELYPVTIDSKRATFEIKHFSGYMVSGGRQGMYSATEF